MENLHSIQINVDRSKAGILLDADTLLTYLAPALRKVMDEGHKTAAIEFHGVRIGSVDFMPNVVGMIIDQRKE